MTKELDEGKEEELIIVEDQAPGSEEPAKKEEGEEKDDDKDDDDEDDEKEEGDEKKDEGDARAATDADADNEPARKKQRKSSKERRRRQKEYADRRERELNYYATRNAELEQKFTELELRQRRSEGITIGQAITTVDAQIKEAERLEAEAIRLQKGEDAVEARSIRESLQGKRERLVAAQDRAKRPPADNGSKTPPPEMQAAMAWIDKNKSWYDHKGGDEDSALAQTIEDRLTREGKFDPKTPAFWTELDRRLQARGVGKRPAGSVQDADLDEDEDEVDEKPGKKEEKPAKKPSGGPKVTVNGSQRSLKANEVYVSPERKKAMQDADLWDHVPTRQKLLKRYQEIDRRAAEASR